MKKSYTHSLSPVQKEPREPIFLYEPGAPGFNDFSPRGRGGGGFSGGRGRGRGGGQVRILNILVLCLLYIGYFHRGNNFDDFASYFQFQFFCVDDYIAPVDGPLLSWRNVHAMHKY